jgi:hypothetical protein
MDDVVNRLARELADAMAAAVADDSRVEACRARARAAGYELHVTLEAVVGFASRGDAVAAPRGRASRVARRTVEMSASDRRFLRSLRIAADEAPEQVE